MGTFAVVVAVAVAYLVLAFVSGSLARVPSDAWAVWLASGVVYGGMIACKRERWSAIAGGGFVGAAVFSLFIDSAWLDAFGYGAIEALSALLGAFIASRIAPTPIRLVSVRELAAVAAGAAVLALASAAAAGLWSAAAGTASGFATFHVWAVGDFVGVMLVGTLVASWSGFRAKRSGGLAMASFAGGAVAFVLFAAMLLIALDDWGGRNASGQVDESIVYLPFVFFAVVALMWGVRGSTLVAFAAAIVAIVSTLQGHGPFANNNGLLGDPVLEVQCYVLAIAVTGLLIATLAASQRDAMNRARDWQTRFTAAIGAHRVLAYDWDPRSNRFEVTGDAATLLGVPAARITTLAEWLAQVAPDDRDRVAARFGDRGAAGGAGDALDYAMGAAGTSVGVVDSAAPIHDHDGELMRIAGIVRVAPA